jgi:hypothetical protein
MALSGRAAVRGTSSLLSRATVRMRPPLRWNRMGFVFLIWRPVDFRPVRWLKRILDNDGFSRGPTRRLRHAIGHGLLDELVHRPDR